MYRVINAVISKMLSHIERFALIRLPPGFQTILVAVTLQINLVSVKLGVMTHDKIVKLWLI